RPFFLAFPAAWARGWGDRRRRRHAAVWLLRIDCLVVFRHPDRRSVCGAARDLLAAAVRLPGAGRAGGPDPGDHRLGLAPDPVQDAGRDRVRPMLARICRRATPRRYVPACGTPLRRKTFLTLHRERGFSIA